MGSRKPPVTHPQEVVVRADAAFPTREGTDTPSIDDSCPSCWACRREIGEGYVLGRIGTLQVATESSIDTPVSRPVAFAALLAEGTASATAVQTLQIMPSFNALR